jgi:hypothetical protein
LRKSPQNYTCYLLDAAEQNSCGCFILYSNKRVVRN